MRKIFTHHKTLSLLLLWVLTCAPAFANFPKEDREKPGQVSLLPLHPNAVPGQDIVLGLSIQMIPGWHTYWRNPGSAGKALAIDWDLPKGVTEAEILYTTPKIIRTFIADTTPQEVLESYGYTGSTIYFLVLKTDKTLSAKSLTLSGTAKFGICAEQCQIQKEPISITLPVSTEEGEVHGFLGPRFAAIPPSFNPAKHKDLQLSLPKVSLKAGEKTDITIKVTSPLGLVSFDPTSLEEAEAGFFPDANDFLYVGIPKYAPGEITFSLEALVETPSGIQELRPLIVARAGGKKISYQLTLPIDIKGVKTSQTPAVRGSTNAGNSPPMPGQAPPPATEPGDNQGTALPFLLLMAFLGGILLNLMPCVLPVLSIKVLGFIQDAQESHFPPVVGALAYAGGVLASFLALGIVLVGLAKTGKALAWGFQFHNPYFILIMAVVLFVFALNLLGVFEISFSGGQTASNLSAKKGLAGSFFSGVLATTLATPCTAPLLSPVFGFALGQPGAHTLLLLSAIGLGLASPYLAISVFPPLLKLVPKPGPWMLRFKQLMSLFLLATMLWMVWLMAQIWPGEGTLLILGVLFLVGVAVWFWGLASKPLNPIPNFRWGSVVLMLAAVGWASMERPNPASSSPAAQKIVEEGWIPFDEKMIAQLRSEGRPVFVDFTADWCLTCKVNHTTVLNRSGFKDLAKAQNMALMVADYTNGPDNLTQFMKRYNRSAVPLYLLFPADQKKGAVILPELLTLSRVESAVKSSL